jgi:hypothetical protein
MHLRVSPAPGKDEMKRRKPIRYLRGIGRHIICYSEFRDQDTIGKKDANPSSRYVKTKDRSAKARVQVQPVLRHVMSGYRGVLKDNLSLSEVEVFIHACMYSIYFLLSGGGGGWTIGHG